MRKNKAMKAASLLLVLTLASSCFVGGTFAKYTTSADGEDTARVAKWGVTLAASGSLYGDQYDKDGKIVVVAETAEDSVKKTISVWGKQDAGTDAVNTVVAPGTKSDKGFHFSINGKPEVDTKITMSIEHQNIFLAKGKYGVMVKVEDVTEDNFVANEYYTVDTNGYYIPASSWVENEKWYALHDEAEVTNAKGYWPVVYSMTDGKDTNENISITGTVDENSLAAIADAIIDEISTSASSSIVDNTNKTVFKYSDVQKKIENNLELSNEMQLGDVAITWEWKFEGVNDGADTILGNLMAARLDEDAYQNVVVKLHGDGTTYEATKVGDDYCLDTKFDIDITVEQRNDD